MKKALMAGALAAALWGGVALAQDNPQENTENQPSQTSEQPSTSQTTQDSWRTSTSPDGNTVVGGQGTEAGTGGSGSAGAAPVGLYNAVDVGSGHYQIRANLPQGPTTLDCVKWDQNSALATGHMQIQANLPQGEGTNQLDCVPVTNGQQSLNAPPPPAATSVQGTGGSGEMIEVEQEKQGADLNGVTVLLGGGVEGYTGTLASRIAPGPTYSASIDFRPTDILGLELGYTGSANELKDAADRGTNPSSGPDVLRNGGRAIGTVGLAATPVQPYLLAGVGLQHYTFRGASKALGFKDDTAGEVPLGAGLRMQAGQFTADLRGIYAVPFDQDIEPGVVPHQTIAGVDTSTAGRYQGELRLGANF
jgi:opacity protein-like surface antigen